MPPAAFGSTTDRARSDGVRSLNPATLTVPDRLGYVIDTFVPDSQPATRNPKLILHLQDLHTQYDAQRALAELIHELRHATHASLVALEGGGQALGTPRSSPPSRIL